MTEERYEITRLLGKGRTGGVYEAEDTNLGRKVALRRFFAQGKQTDLNEYKADFEKVAHTLSSLQHPNLLRVYDAGVDGDGAYIISHLLKGETLYDELTKNGSMPVWEVNDLAQQMLDALSSAHEGGFVHGAITPGSILLTPRARGGYLYVILDMGLSRLAPLIQGKDSILSIMADPAILAPELFNEGVATERADLYMLGQIFYMALVGGHPFAGIPADAAKKRHEEGLPPLQQFVSDIPEDFRLWLEKLTEIDPANRPASAVEALHTLPRVGRPAKINSATTQMFPVLAKTGSVQQPHASTGINPITSNAGSGLRLMTGVTAAAPHSATAATGVLRLPVAKKDPKKLIFVGLGVFAVILAISITVISYRNNTDKIVASPEVVSDRSTTVKIEDTPKVASDSITTAKIEATTKVASDEGNAATIKTTLAEGLIFSEDFESWDGISGVRVTSSGSLTSSSWGNLTGYKLRGLGTNLLRPLATDNGWLHPIPAAVGSTFAVLFHGCIVTADLSGNFVDNTIYTLTFDQFKRNDLDGDSITARIMNGNTVLASQTFDAVTSNSTIAKRAIFYTTSGGPEVGSNIRLQLSDLPDLKKSFRPPQVAIDNIKLEATKVP